MPDRAYAQPAAGLEHHRLNHIDDALGQLRIQVEHVHATLTERLGRIADSLAAHYQHAGHDQAAAILQALRRAPVDDQPGRYEGLRPGVAATLSAMDRVTQWDAEQVIYRVLVDRIHFRDGGRAHRIAQDIAAALYGEATEMAPVATGYHPPGHVNVAGVDDPAPVWVSIQAEHDPAACPYCNPGVGGHVDLVEPQGLPSGTRVVHRHLVGGVQAGTVQGIGHDAAGPTCLVLWDAADDAPAHARWVPAADLGLLADQTCSHLAEGTDRRCGADARVVTRLGWRCPDHAPADQPEWVDDGRVAGLPDGSMTVALPPDLPTFPAPTGDVVADVIAIADATEGTPLGDALEAAGRAMADEGAPTEGDGWTCPECGRDPMRCIAPTEHGAPR